MSLNQSINIDDLPKLIQNNPQLATLYGAIYGIDRSARKVILETIERFDDPERYAIKTQLSNQCYDILLYHRDIRAIVGTTWPLADFIEMCKRGSDCLNSTVAYRITQILKRFEKPNTLDLENENINWI